MGKINIGVSEVLDQLESFYGKQEPCWPVDPYLFLVWWHCGYPASDAACSKGWESLTKEVGVSLPEILAAPPAKLARALKPGGMVPEIRAIRLKEIAARIKDELSGDLRAALVGPISQVRKILKKFPNIADPGADRILLFGEIAPVAAVPSNCPHVLVRIQHGQERQNYGVTAKKQVTSDGYAMDHSSSIYLIDGNGKLRALMPYGHDADTSSATRHAPATGAVSLPVAGSRFQTLNIAPPATSNP